MEWKKCYMLGARRLSIEWGDTPKYWKWIPNWKQSRFFEVAELGIVWWLDIKGRVETSMLSPKTRYAAYFVYKLNGENNGFEERTQQFRERGDGWMEVEMGEFFNDGGEEDDHRVWVFSLFDFDGYTTKSGLVVEGIELRPKAIDR
ncbi:hypothetical protein FNV43_RR02312 [Rhamnella rubrinervis]|uniref:Uncharacterized protein n=1 Tax=Rhamnella rubrinervis TaxID=2594499 RepID=A0A8K0MTM1_9ROSA|nr:hypothetical protein FNV43_RR02312 [Rhamnella rubrinervis]